MTDENKDEKLDKDQQTKLDLDDKETRESEVQSNSSDQPKESEPKDQETVSEETKELPEKSEQKEAEKELEQDLDSEIKQIQVSKPLASQVYKKPKAKYVEKGEKVKEGTKSNISKGELLEYRLKRLLFHMGYFTKNNVIMKTSQDEMADVITDLDVYGTYVHKDFTSKTLWVDCKSGGARVHERISWIKGIMDTININDMIFVKSGVRFSVKQYARNSGIQILDLKIIEKLEQDYSIQPNNWHGSWNYKTQHNKLTTFSRISIPTNAVYKKIANFISSDYWTLDNYSRIKKTITALRDLSPAVNMPMDPEEINAIRWAIYELVSLFLLALLNISKELYYFSDVEKRETVQEGLSAGEVSNRKRAEIFDAAFRVAYSHLQTQIPDFKPPVRMPTINLSPPGYYEAFYDLVLRVTNSPLNYYDLLRFIDFSLMEYDLNSEEIDEDVLRKMFENYDTIIIGAKTLLHFICQVTGIPRAQFQLIN